MWSSGSRICLIVGEPEFVSLIKSAQKDLKRMVLTASLLIVLNAQHSMDSVKIMPASSLVSFSKAINRIASTFE